MNEVEKVQTTQRMEKTPMIQSASRKQIRLLALDIDGTLFDTNGKINASSIAAIQYVQSKGVIVVPASGRDYDGLPWEKFRGLELPYVITTNGSAVYETAERSCLKEECLDAKKMVPILEYLLEKEVYVGIFVDGVNYTPTQVLPYIDYLSVPEYVKTAIRENTNGLDNLVDYIKRENVKIQKATLNFQQLPDGSLKNREEVQAYLQACPELNVVDGGFGNLEFTKAGVSKKSGVQFLAEYLGLTMDEVMAIGDSENDIEMLKAVGIGIAMGNAFEQVKAIADDVTRTNDEDGVAFAVEKYKQLLGECNEKNFNAGNGGNNCL